MTIDKECEAKILRYHFVEHWGVHTIASQLNLHHSTVDRVLSQAGLPKVERAMGPSIIDPYLPLIVETLEQYPRLTAARLYGMALERGYTGGVSHFRARVAQLRPRPRPEAYLRLKTLPGEAAQVDWGSFSHVYIGKAKRALDGLCDGAQLESPDLPAILSQPAYGEFFARSCRRLRGLWRVFEDRSL